MAAAAAAPVVRGQARPTVNTGSRAAVKNPHPATPRMAIVRSLCTPSSTAAAPIATVAARAVATLPDALPSDAGRSRVSAAAARLRNDAVVDIRAARTAIPASSTAHGPSSRITAGVSSSGRATESRPSATSAVPARPTPSHTASIAASAPVSTAGSRRSSAGERRKKNFWM